MTTRPRLTRRAVSELPLVAEVAGSIAIARVLVHLPFRRYAGLIGPAEVGAPVTPRAGAAADARRVRWAVDRVSRRMPGRSTCLSQALAAKWCLGRRGVPTTLHLGVLRRSTDGRIGAHAWLTCGPLVVTGEPARRASTPLAAYS